MSPIQFTSTTPTTFTDIEFHDAAGIFELLDGAEFAELVDDIKAHGQKLPIVLHEGKILDGRNRYRACRAAGVEPVFRQWDGVGSASDFVWSLNNHRRHLDGNARAIAAGRYASAQQSEAKARQVSSLKRGEKSPLAANDANGEAGRSRTAAAEKFGVSEGTVDRAVKVIKKGSPDLQKAVADDKISISAASEIAAFPPEKQNEIVASANPVAALATEKKRVEDFRQSLPKPKEAKRLAKEKGGVFLATDGRYHSGSTEEEKATTSAFLSVFNWAADAADPDVRKAPEVVAAGCPSDAVDQFVGYLQDAEAYLHSIIKIMLKERVDAEKS